MPRVKKTKEADEDWDMECKPKKKWHQGQGTFGWFYFLGIIATAIYYIQQVHGFWLIVLALLKAIIWPLFLIYKVFSLLNM